MWTDVDFPDLSVLWSKPQCCFSSIVSFEIQEEGEG